jgi:hypothetical protein
MFDDFDDEIDPDGDAGADVVRYPARQALKTRSRDVYCSGYDVRNHDEGRDWVTRCMENFGLQAADIHSVYLVENCPRGAIVWP